jgi:hypothetical protein
MINQTRPSVGTVTMSPTRNGFLVARKYPSPMAYTSNRSGPFGTRAAGVVLLGLVLVTAASGCGGSGVHTQAGPGPTSSPTISASPSSEQPDPSPRQIAAAAAIAQVRRYEAVLDDLSTHTRLSLNRLNSVSTSPDLAEEVGSLNQFRESRDRQLGSSRVTSARIDRVTLPSGGGGTHRALATVRLSICLNVDRVRAFGPAGHSIVPKSRKPYFLTHLTVVNRSYPKKSTWLVSNRTDREVDRCAV